MNLVSKNTTAATLVHNNPNVT